MSNSFEIFSTTAKWIEAILKAVNASFEFVFTKIT